MALGWGGGVNFFVYYQWRLKVENILGMILNAENGRMLAIMILGYFGYVRIIGQMKEGDSALEKKIDGVEASLNKRIDGVEVSLNKRIDGLETSLDKKIDENLIAFHAMLKTNDFAHLNHTIEALTFTLEKNGFLKREDKEYINSRLDK
jgi:hypothetical protein